jgi:hypothetical protein
MRIAAFQCGIFITLGIATASQAQAVFPCSAASGRGDMASRAYVGLWKDSCDFYP